MTDVRMLAGLDRNGGMAIGESVPGAKATFSLPDGPSPGNSNQSPLGGSRRDPTGGSLVRVVAGTDSQIIGKELAPDQEAIRAALALIVTSHWFRNTKRCRDLLEFVVGETLAGRGNELTERNIGVLVFGRAPDYDTNDDSVVRTSALEVRKRLAQYYHELEHETAVRIELAPGGYVPDFRHEVNAPPRSEAPLEAQPAREAVSDPSSARHSRPALWAAGALVVAGIIVATVWLLRPSDPLSTFWGPIYKGATGMIVAVGAGQISPQPGDAPAGNGDPSTLDVVRSDRAGFADAVVLAQVTGLLESRGKHVDLRRASSVTLDDLRRMPAVFVGNSPWTERLSAGLKYQVQHDAVAGTLEIVDRDAGAPTPWRINFMAPYSERSQDWAVITRFRDPRTQQIALLLCGLGRDGTAAAGEFISRPKLLDTLIRQAPPGWERKNFQVVIGVDLIHGNAGPPHVLATYFW